MLKTLKATKHKYIVFFKLDQYFLYKHNITSTQRRGRKLIYSLTLKTDFEVGSFK